MSRCPAPEGSALALLLQNRGIEGRQPVTERLQRAVVVADGGVDARIGVVAAVSVIDERGEEGGHRLLNSAQYRELGVAVECDEVPRYTIRIPARGFDLDGDQSVQKEATE